jgi:glutamate-1-semialdehyde 2,1-aminomutase
VLPEDGFLDGVRELSTRHGTLPIVDETHTLSAGPGGCTAAWGLEPDAITLGESIAGGVPIGAYGVSAELAERIAAEEDADYEDTGGVGGTLAGSALSLAAVCAPGRSRRPQPTGTSRNICTCTCSTAAC